MQLHLHDLTLALLMMNGKEGLLAISFGLELHLKMEVCLLTDNINDIMHCCHQYGHWCTA